MIIVYLVSLCSVWIDIMTLTTQGVAFSSNSEKSLTKSLAPAGQRFTYSSVIHPVAQEIYGRGNPVWHTAMYMFIQKCHSELHSLFYIIQTARHHTRERNLKIYLKSCFDWEAYWFMVVLILNAPSCRFLSLVTLVSEKGACTVKQRQSNYPVFRLWLGKLSAK